MISRLAWSEDRGPRLEEFIQSRRRAFLERFSAEPRFIAHAPGRINVIGEHTDYNGGLALPGAVDRWIGVAIEPLADSRFTLFSENFKGEISGDVAAIPAPVKPWHHHLLGCVALFFKTFPSGNGFRATVGGNIPVGAGMSSSAALELALMGALGACYGHSLTGPRLASMCQRVENDYLGLPSGLMDQLVCQMARRAHLLLMDFARETWRHVAVDLGGHVWVLLDSGVRRRLSDSGYARRVRECRRALSLLGQHVPSLSHLGQLGPAHMELMDSLGDLTPIRRARHQLTENLRVGAALEALALNDAEALGELLLESHESLGMDFQVSCPELDFLVERAGKAPGFLGGRMMGAGFGGCTLNLVRGAALGCFLRAMNRDWQGQTGRELSFQVCRLVDGASVRECPDAAPGSRNP